MMLYPAKSVVLNIGTEAKINSRNIRRYVEPKKIISAVAKFQKNSSAEKAEKPTETKKDCENMRQSMITAVEGQAVAEFQKQKNILFIRQSLVAACAKNNSSGPKI